MKYKNIFLLKDYDDGSIDAIIETEENDIFIQDNINKAKKELEELSRKQAQQERTLQNKNIAYCVHGYTRARENCRNCRKKL